MREVDSVVFTADSKTLLSSGPEPVVHFWDVEQGNETRHLDTGISHVRALALTADDKTLIVGGQHKTLKIFNLLPPRCSKTARAIATGSCMPIDSTTTIRLLPSAVQKMLSPARAFQFVRPTNTRFGEMPFQSKKLS